MRATRFTNRRVTTSLAALALGALAVSATSFGASASPTVSLDAGISPNALPRKDRVPVQLHINTTLGSNDGKIPPKVRSLEIAFNRSGKIHDRGLPTCAVSKLEALTAAAALQACRSALVGRGTISGTIEFPDREPFSATGTVNAFNGRSGGRDAILMQVEVAQPAHVAFVLPLVPSRAPGQFATRFTAEIPAVAGGFGTLTGLDLTMGRQYRFRGKRHSFLSANCPAPPGLPGGVFPLAQANYHLETGGTLSQTALGQCRAKRKAR